MNRLLRLKQCPKEARLWDCLQGLKHDSLKFRRHLTIGPYVVDFCALDSKLIVEVNRTPAGQNLDNYDKMRIKYLEDLGYKVLRFHEEETLSQAPEVVKSIQTCLAGMRMGN